MTMAHREVMGLGGRNCSISVLLWCPDNPIPTRLQQERTGEEEVSSTLVVLISAAGVFRFWFSFLLVVLYDTMMIIAQVVQ